MGTELICIIASPVLHQGQLDGGESCIVLESGPTRSLVAKFTQRSSLAARKFRTAESCKQGYGQVCANICCRMLWWPTVHQNDVDQLSIHGTTQEF